MQHRASSSDHKHDDEEEGKPTVSPRSSTHLSLGLTREILNMGPKKGVLLEKKCWNICASERNNIFFLATAKVQSILGEKEEAKEK